MDALEISIHALREEGDIYIVDGTPVLDGFLSTPSARRATLLLFRGSYLLSISIHALREEGDAFGHRAGLSQPISIHALREEGDPGSSPRI